MDKKASAVRLAALSSILAGGSCAASYAKIHWVTIPGGSFDMGSGEGLDEVPRHRVRVRTFQLAKSEVTVAQYKACVSAGKCLEPGRGGHCNWARAGRENHPVNCVDWERAKVFSEWAGGRLPSEAEWEYAARSLGKDWKFPWGNEAATCARAVMNSGGYGCGKNSTWPVCAKTAGNTSQGLCDMAGNVWEWVRDWYHPSYERAPADGGAWERPVGSSLVDRGGSWSSIAWSLRSTCRYHNDPGSRHDNVGFRPARDVGQTGPR